MNCTAATRLHAARAWLAHTLASGPVPAAEVQAAAAAAGHAMRTVERARLALGVVATKGAMRGGWVWALPPTSKGANPAAEGHLGATRFGPDEPAPEVHAGEAAQVRGVEPELPEIDLPELPEIDLPALPEIDLPELPEFEPTYPGDLVLVTERIYLDAGGLQALPEGHPDCASLLATPGDELSAAEARALGVTTAGLARCRPG